MSGEPELRPSSRERRGLAGLWELLEEHRQVLDAALQELVREIPSLAPLARDGSGEAVRERTRALQRAAMLDDAWEPYVRDLRRQGRGYAAAGVPFGAWHRLLRVYRRDLRELVLEALSERPERLAEVLIGLQRWLDVAVQALTEGYLEALPRVRRERDVFASFFHESSVGMQVYRWEAPPDPGSFRLIAANPAAPAPSDGEPTVGLTLAETDSTLLESPVVGWFVDCLHAGEPLQWDIDRPAADGSSRHFDVRCFPIGDDILGVMYEDVTERHETLQRLEQYVVALERSNAELDQFAYVASHDLKAPLRDLDNLSGWIAEDLGDDLPEASTRHLGLLRSRVRRMEQLLDDLLQYARIDRTPLAAERVDIAALVTEHAALVAPDDTLDLHLAPDLPVLRTPRAPLAQVFRNLIGNAVQHRRDDRVRVEIEAAPRGSDRVEFRVRDDGPGIDPRFQDRIFEMFTTLRSRDDVEASGMGLAIVRKLVEARGGSITVDSAPGEGATFCFTWPRRVDAGDSS